MIATAAMAATLALANPLLGTWVARGPAAPPRSTMTITADAISFGSGGRALGVLPVAGFERRDGIVAVRTRLGALYRFRFDAAGGMCRVPAIGAGVVECFAKARATA